MESPGDVAAISDVIAEFEHAQQHELPDAFADLFRSDAIWTTGHGLLLIGQQAISAFTHRVLPGAMRESTATYEIVHIVFIRPDVAAVKVRQRPVTLDGQPIESEQEGTPLLVMSKEAGRWRLVACQNTAVLDA